MTTSRAKCPSCGRLTEADYRPFCSRRCADLDLSRWLSGAYAVPAVEDESEEAARYDPDED
jgi:hypothetical protein